MVGACVYYYLSTGCCRKPHLGLQDGLCQLFLRLGGQGVVQWGTQGQECLDSGGG